MRSMTGQRQSLLTELRAATAAAHTSLEAALPMEQITGSRLGYTAVLSAFYAYFSAWEARARHAAPYALRPLLKECERAPLLLRDLAALGAATQRFEAEPSVPGLQPESALLGSMYVLEGSRLGGQLLARGAEQRLALAPAQGTAFFRGFGPETSSHWQRFRTLLEAAGADAGTAIRAACATFAGIEAWMTYAVPHAQLALTEGAHPEKAQGDAPCTG